MNATEVIAELDAMPEGDNEMAHIRADELLIEFLKLHDAASYDVAKAWERACKRVGFWYWGP
jgi:hypothetical protein